MTPRGSLARRGCTVDLNQAIRAMRKVELINLVLILLAAATVHVLSGPGPFLWGVLVGGLIGVLNLRTMIFLTRRIFTAESRSRALWSILFILKLGVLCAAIWLSLSALPLDAIGFLIGFAMLLPASLVFTLVRALEPAKATDTALQGEQRP